MGKKKIIESALKIIIVVIKKMIDFQQKKEQGTIYRRMSQSTNFNTKPYQ